MTCFAGRAGGSGGAPRQHRQLPPHPRHRGPHSSHQLGRQMPCGPCRFNAKRLFFFQVRELPGGTRGADGLRERCSCPLSTKPPIRAGRWEGGELLYKQSFKINCFSSLKQELAFQPWDTIRACSDCIFSGAVYSQGCLAGAG